MALNFDEMEQCYSSLTDLSKRYGLNWVIEQVESQIALGKIGSGKIRAREVPLANGLMEDVQRQSRGRPTQFTVSEQFTPAEKLKILIEALRHAVKGVWQIAWTVSNYLTDNIDGLHEVRFEPEGISKEGLVLDRLDIQSREAAVNRLDALIHEIEEAI